MKQHQVYLMSAMIYLAPHVSIGTAVITALVFIMLATILFILDLIEDKKKNVDTD